MASRTRQQILAEESGGDFYSPPVNGNSVDDYVDAEISRATASAGSAQAQNKQQAPMSAAAKAK